MRSRRENCRDILIQYIDRRDPGHRRRLLVHGGRDLHGRALKRAWLRGVPVRVLMDRPRQRDLSAEPQPTQRNQDIVPHHGWQVHPDAPASHELHPPLEDDAVPRPGVVEFSGANFSADAWRPSPGTPPYSNYTDESIFFTSDPAARQQLRDQVRRSLDEHDRMGELRQRRRSARSRVRDQSRRIRRSTSRRPRTTGRAPSPATTPRSGRSTSSCSASRTAPTPTRSSMRSRAAFPVRLITEPDQYRDITPHVGRVERRPSPHGRRPGQDARRTPD